MKVAASVHHSESHQQKNRQAVKFSLLRRTDPGFCPYATQNARVLKKTSWHPISPCLYKPPTSLRFAWSQCFPKSTALSSSNAAALRPTTIASKRNPRSHHLTMPTNGFSPSSILAQLHTRPASCCGVNCSTRSVAQRLNDERSSCENEERCSGMTSATVFEQLFEVSNM